MMARSAAVPYRRVLYNDFVGSAPRADRNILRGVREDDVIRGRERSG